MYTVRGNHYVKVPDTPVDPTWTPEDLGRHCTLQARFPDVDAELLQCWVWKTKVPGLQYPGAIEFQLATLAQK